MSLLALQGVFTLIQKHNITYPNVYEKLYSMFEPEIFHTKYKARLFYLADIFLSSTHLPENLVAAFMKRLARLSLIAPPQDTVIMLQFIGNLLLRHLGLKRLICATQATEGICLIFYYLHLCFDEIFFLIFCCPQYPPTRSICMKVIQLNQMPLTVLCGKLWPCRNTQYPQ